MTESFYDTSVCLGKLKLTRWTKDCLLLQRPDVFCHVRTTSNLILSQINPVYYTFTPWFSKIHFNVYVGLQSGLFRKVLVQKSGRIV
jgi:hypothetical protein